MPILGSSWFLALFLFSPWTNWSFALDSQFCLLGDQVNGLFARQGSLSDVPWLGLLRFVHSLVLLFSLLVLTSLGGFFSLNNALSDRTFVVRGSCGLDFHVSCPLAWTFFSELLPHSGGISPWRRVTQGTLFSWVPSSVLRLFLIGRVPSLPVLSGVRQAGRFDSSSFQFLVFSNPLVELTALLLPCVLVSNLPRLS